MPKELQVQDLTELSKMANLLQPVQHVELITVTTIKKGFVKQMHGMDYKTFVNGIKDGTVKMLGVCRTLSDFPDYCIIVRKRTNQRLYVVKEIKYREYLATHARMDLNLMGDEISDFVKYQMDNMPQLFTT